MCAHLCVCMCVCVCALVCVYVCVCVCMRVHVAESLLVANGSLVLTPPQGSLPCLHACNMNFLAFLILAVKALALH